MARPHIILFSALLIISITLLSLNEQTKLNLSAELSSVLLFPVKTVTQFVHFLSISNARITELEIKLHQLQFENDQLKKRIPLDTTNFITANYTLIKVDIIGRDPSNINGFLYIDKGKQQDVYINQPVVSLNGLVGKIKYVGTKYCIVETIENQGFAVSAIDVNTRIHGVVKKKGELILDYIKIDDELHIGDSIRTSGMSEVFPQGILIGTVKKIERGTHPFFKPVYIKPSVRINRLAYVYIISGFKTPELGDFKELMGTSIPSTETIHQ